MEPLIKKPVDAVMPQPALLSSPPLIPSSDQKNSAN